MLGWRKHKLESRLLGEISITSDIQMTERKEELKSHLMKMEEESEKPGLKFNIQKASAQMFKSINSSAVSFLHSPTLASIYDYWKNHSLE